MVCETSYTVCLFNGILFMATYNRIQFCNEVHILPYSYEQFKGKIEIYALRLSTLMSQRNIFDTQNKYFPHT